MRPGGLRGRHAERQELDRLVANARAGMSGALVVLGDAGIGKTALLDYLLGHAAGCRIVQAAGVESELELAFAGLHQVCAPFLDRLDRLPEPQRDALGTAFGLRGGPPPDRFLVGLAVLSLLSDVAETQPLICLLDDAHWLDQVSAQVLGFVARRLAAESVVIIFAVRRPGTQPHFAGLPELAVGPLRDADARDLLAYAMPGKIDESVRDRIVAEARGNPLALLELPRAWTPAAFAGGFGLPDGESVSGRIEESFRRRLMTLSVSTRRLLLVAAASPTGDATLIRAAAGRLGIPAEAAHSASAAGLFDAAPRLRFRHPLVRTVVYQDAPMEDRRLVHATLAEVTDPELDPDRRAWHLAAATAGPDEAVALTLEQSAGRAQSRGGMAAAAAFLKRAVDLTAEPGRRCERVMAAGHAMLQAGGFEAALELIALAESGSLDDFQRARLDLLRGHVAFASGRVHEAPSLLQRAASQLAAFAPDLARETYLTAWAGAVATAHLTGSVALREICQAIQALPPQNPPRPLDLLLSGLAQLTTEGLAAAAPTLRQAATSLADLPVAELHRWGLIAAGASSAVWDFSSFDAITTRRLQLVRASGAIAELPIQLSASAVAKTWTGDLTAAAALIAECDVVAAATGAQLDPYALLRLRALQGKDAGALIAAVQGHPHAFWAGAVLGNGLAHYQDAAAAAAKAVACDYDPWVSIWAVPELVEALARSGDHSAAVDAAARFAAASVAVGHDAALGVAVRCQALVTDDAELYLEAIDRLGRSGLRPDLARAHLLYGEWLRRNRRRADARVQLRTAYDQFCAIGMTAFGERARRELLGTGETVRSPSFATAEELTAQELQIARLACDGRTNADVGAELFLSPRTVEWHLRKVFAKLGIASRTDLARALPPEA